MYNIIDGINNSKIHLKERNRISFKALLKNSEKNVSEIYKNKELKELMDNALATKYLESKPKTEFNFNNKSKSKFDQMTNIDDNRKEYKKPEKNFEQIIEENPTIELKENNQRSIPKYTKKVQFEDDDNKQEIKKDEDDLISKLQNKSEGGGYGKINNITRKKIKK